MSNIVDSIGTTVEKLGNAFDKNFTSKEEVLEQVGKAQAHLLEVKQAIILAEMQGSKMQRNWRPFLMYLFGIIIAYSSMLAPILYTVWGVPKPEMTSEFWDVIQLSIGGYVIGRSTEKIMPGVTEATRKVMSSRKERRQERKNERQN